MKKIIIEETNTSPGVVLDAQKGLFNFTGNFSMNNTEEFFEPVEAWIDDYVKTTEPQSAMLVFDMEYFHMVTAKKFLDIFQKLEEVHNSTDHKFHVVWMHYGYDSDMAEAGKEYSSIVDVPFDIVQKN